MYYTGYCKGWKCGKFVKGIIEDSRSNLTGLKLVKGNAWWLNKVRKAVRQKKET